MSLKILILEDKEERMVYFRRALIGNDVDHTEFAHEAIELLKKNKYDIAFLDHDLGGQEMVSSGPGTGYEVAVFLNKNKKHMPNQVIIHSFNSVGSLLMRKLLPESVYYPGIHLVLENIMKEG